MCHGDLDPKFGHRDLAAALSRDRSRATLDLGALVARIMPVLRQWRARLPAAAPARAALGTEDRG